ncbi:tetratricopeptide repeat protein [Azospira restricta]|uniref:Sel1 repeat family protein n=1 Tax=Azospira restricta TaxID=404405 RepID=A0A974PWB9_9RHOO|nr:tetratricopeptide repeat protein [Azospira restricta]QRJ62436.1 sel1 repeat family protein [Azospira restricta]
MSLQRIFRISLAGALLLPALAVAGAAEDYAVAKKAYDAGDVVGAMPLLRKGTDAGHAPSMVLLGDILDSSEFDEEAAVVFRKAADLGDAEGQFRLGKLYSLGEGVKKDLAEAHRLILAAAKQGHRQATNVIAQAYLSAQLGIPESAREGEESLRWVKAAVDNDYLPAIDAMVLAYRNGGFGLAPDAKEADRLQAKANALRNVQQATTRPKRRAAK